MGYGAETVSQWRRDMKKILVISFMMMLMSGAVWAKQCKFYKPGGSLKPGCSWVCINGEWVSMCQ